MTIYCNTKYVNVVSHSQNTLLHYICLSSRDPVR